MQRRDFAKSAIVGMAAAAAVTAAARAAGDNPDKNVVFTEANPGHWEKVISLHIPQMTTASGKLTVKTPHPQSEVHYIVSHTVVLGDGTFVSRKTFSYRDEPISEHMLPVGYAGEVTVTSTCNQHDYWAKTIKV